VKAVGRKGGVCGSKDFKKRYRLSLEWKKVELMDNDSGCDGKMMILDDKNEQKNDKD